MRPDDRRDSRRQGQGGIPDGLLVGTLAFLLGMTVLVWTATGLAAWLAQGAWPTGVTFTRTPLAMRHLVGRPHDLPGAWPDTPPAQLSGWGLFWGLLIGQLMILLVLTVFVMGVIARWRAGKARRAAAKGGGPGDTGPAVTGPTVTGPPVTGPAVTGPPVTGPAVTGPPVTGPAVTGPPVMGPAVPGSAVAGPPVTGTAAAGPAITAPAVTGLAPTAPAPAPPPPQHEVPAPRSEPVPQTSGVFPAGGERLGGWERVLIAPRESRHATAARAVRDAEGPLLLVTSGPALWAETKDTRAKLGPTLLYDPTHLCDTPARLHWSPTSGCEDKQTALHRATALLAPVRPTAKIDQAVADTAITLLRSYLHAAALENRTVRHVHRWSQGLQVHEAVRTLRTHAKAAPGAAGELEAALTAHPERRDIAQELTSRALAALSTVNVREACTPNRTDALALDSFVHEGGTLYVVGESIEDPRSRPGAMPLLTALVSSVVERGRRMAERSSSGRLDPPLTLVLDDIAAVAPFPELPALLATGADQGLPTLALLRSREQARSRWPHQELPV
ncbi:type VI secretion protein [Streptomyces sp. PBH53]|uniref:type IV secretory system conjugative DNA transfer family protein n=1 Tax=Streptomyces TaxID=1883 RepID=UPI0006550983|nr:type IV secretory system conjugative DNA transfer family protein [Streptomyces sp. PBH53]AKN73092.1 type VI secretion protein [Streptomyces sp. PBH53]